VFGYTAAGNSLSFFWLFLFSKWPKILYFKIVLVAIFLFFGVSACSQTGEGNFSVFFGGIFVFSQSGSRP
jgi:hypothetical protein